MFIKPFTLRQNKDKGNDVNSLLLCHLGANKREAIAVCPHFLDFDFYNQVSIVDVVPIPLSHHESLHPLGLLTDYSFSEICKRKSKRKYVEISSNIKLPGG